MSAIPKWTPGTAFILGDLVVPASNSIVLQEQPYNNSFEDGLTQWNVTGVDCTDAQAQANTVATSSESYDGTQSATVMPFAGNGSLVTDNGNQVAAVYLTNTLLVPVNPGQVINFQMRARHEFVSDTSAVEAYCALAAIAWYDASNVFINYSYALNVSAGSNGLIGVGIFCQFVDSNWVILSGTGTAPTNAAYAAAVCGMTTTQYAEQGVFIDYYTWDYTHQGYPTGLAFVCVQAGTSGTVEPTWPVVAGNTVYDPNTAGVEWEAEYASQITWTASSILTSGATQPTWPTTIGASILDNDIEWTATDGRITDPNCPQSTVVTIASAKVYAADNDIIRFSATANAQDWTSSQDAGFIPFGLQAYGSEPCAGLGLYRSNLVAFNSLGYQMWQVDPDPTNIAILDAEPVGCDYPKSIIPVNNDLCFVSPVGIRNIGTAGASGNLQAGQFGKQVDPLVRALIKYANLNGYEIRGLFSPGTGQYWLIFGPTVIVLTINGNNTMSWSRYVFPAYIDSWTVQTGVLYLRAGDLVWELSADAYNDDVQQTTAEGGTNTGFDGYMAWNYLDCGQYGVDKEMEGFDITIGNIDDEGMVVNNNVTCLVSIGYNQGNPEMATTPYEIIGDSVPGTMIPMPMTAPSFQVRLDFGTGQNWGWGALNLYMMQVYKQ